MASKRRLEGYLLVDNRHAPAIDANQVRAFERQHGPVTAAGVTGLFESATLTCAHCHAQIVLNPNRSRPRHYCSKCDKYVCDNAACVLECSPLNAVFDQLQAAAGRRGF
jgi:hypothetical protein